MLSPFNKSIKKSIPASVTVCGYVIKKRPIGAYLDAITRIDSLPADLLEACFPGMSLGEVFAALKELDTKMLTQVLLACMQVAPAFLLQLVSDLSLVPYASLRDDEAIGLDGLVDIVKAVWEVNDLGKILATLGQLTTAKSPASSGSKS